MEKNKKEIIEEVIKPYDATEFDNIKIYTIPLPSDNSNAMIIQEQRRLIEFFKMKKEYYKNRNRK